jgi:hypothetical protein
MTLRKASRIERLCLFSKDDGFALLLKDYPGSGDEMESVAELLWNYDAAVFVHCYGGVHECIVPFLALPDTNCFEKNVPRG